MIYVALLRGINVGGNNKVEMKRLKASFESLGLSKIKTYINSGNIIFEDTSHTEKELADLIEKIIEKDFGFVIKVLVRNFKAISKITAELPSSWTNNDKMKCDVMFLWEEVDNSKILEKFTVDRTIEDVRYIPGVVLWRIDREHINKSKMLKLISTKLYSQMTVRNCNTLRKLHDLMKDLEAVDNT